MTPRLSSTRARRLWPVVWRTVAITLLSCMVLGGGAAVVAVRAGWYDAGAIRQHW